MIESDVLLVSDTLLVSDVLRDSPKAAATIPPRMALRNDLGMSADPDRQPDSAATPAQNAMRGPEATRNSLLWQLLLQARRQELVGPLDHILDLAGRLGEHSRQIGWTELAADLVKIAAAAETARTRIADTLLAGGSADAADADAVRSRLQHDLRNRLNVMLGYAEDWLDDSEEPLPDDLAGDLRLIVRAGRTCLQQVDTILAPRGAGAEATADGPAADNAAQQIRDLIDTMQRPHRPAREVGRILIVDDEPLNREVLRRRLERIGHTVSEVDSAAAALHTLAEQSFDLVLLDILLIAPATGAAGHASGPERSGFDVLARLKADERLRDLPVILVSALTETDLVARGIELGAEDYLARPIDPTLLQARVEACLEKVRLRQRERAYLAEIEHERRRADELLHVLLPEEVIAQLKRTDQIPPRRYEGVAVLFADICGFTPYCDHRPPEEVISRLAGVVDLWEHAAARHNVQKIKTIGDAFMAAAGLFGPADDNNAVLACVRCGLEMLAGTTQLVPDWQLRVGIHYGEVVGGKVGRRQYLFDLWGDTVNTAARMESHGVPGSITLSRTAWNEIAAAAHGEEHQIAVKGKGVQDVVRLLRLKASGASNGPGSVKDERGQ